MTLEIKDFYDSDTATYSYIISDSITNKAAIIDPVLNYDQYSGRISTNSAEELITYLKNHHLKLEWILESHIHADHLTAADYLRKKLGARIAIGCGIKQVFDYWQPIFNLEAENSFDEYLEDQQIISLGQLSIKVLHTPGHTPACVSFLIEDAVFVGDLIFMPDIGTGRTDFPGGSAHASYQSIMRIFALGDQVRVFTGHDYPPPERTPHSCSTVASQKQDNIVLNKNTLYAEFIANRQARDLNKPVPKLLLPALQVNLKAGRYGHELKIPLNQI